jgi:parvulin-like peptidyl-prolyl isomerase
MAVAVNDSVITLGEIENRVEGGAQIAAKAYGNDQPRFEAEVHKLRDEAIEQMVENKLILHEFITSGYVTNVLEAFIDDRIQETIQRDYYGDRARLIQTLHEKGLTYEMYRRQQREDFIIHYMEYQNSSNPRKILISPLKVEQYYQGHKDEFKMDVQVKLRMIVLPQSPDSTAVSAKKVGEEILSKIDAGTPFAEMAAVYSSGSQRAVGGDRGWVDHTYFKPSLAEIAFSLKPGQHSSVIEQPEACYLMMVEDMKPAHIRPLSEVRADIERTLRNDENLRLRKIWIERLKRKSFINFY